VSENRHTRRNLLRLAGIAGTALVFCEGRAPAADEEDKPEHEVGAVEDLMREHGVLRRALLVYAETVDKLRGGASIDAKAINKTAKLFRNFGEDYHERKLEEAYIFPAVKKVGSSAALLADVLKSQHDRGREITDYILGVTRKGSIKSDAETFAHVLDGFVLMYQNHAAREDTVVFPAWKDTLSDEQLHELGEEFEEIEHKEFGEDGFESAVKEIGDIEEDLGLAQLAQFTAPSPPRR